MTTTTDVLEGLRAMAGKSPGRKRQAAKPADDAAWLEIVQTYSELAPLVRAASAKLERLKKSLKEELRQRDAGAGDAPCRGEGVEIVTSAGIVGMDGVDVEGYEVRSHRKQALTLRAPR
jgi:hypothetical protein